MPSRICTARSSDGSLTAANRSPRIGSAAKPISNNGRRPQICARRPTHGDSAATMSLRHDDAGRDDDRRPMRRAHGHRAADQRQHGGIGEMEQQQAAGEDQKRPIVHQRSRLNRGFVDFAVRRRAVRPLGIDFVVGDRAQRDQRGHQQQHGDDEHGARGKQITAGAHGGRRQAVADGCEARIASEPLADRRVTDEAEADRRDRRAEHATRQRVQDRSRQHHRKDRQHRIAQGADADRHDRNAGDEALGSGGIDQGAARHLSDQRNEARRRLHEPDIDLGPALRGEINRDERPESGLHVGDEENEPIEPAQAALRRRERRLGPLRAVGRARCLRRRLAPCGSGRSRKRRDGFSGQDTSPAVVSSGADLVRQRWPPDRGPSTSVIARSCAAIRAVARACRAHRGRRWASPPDIRARPSPGRA